MGVTKSSISNCILVIVFEQVVLVTGLAVPGRVAMIVLWITFLRHADCITNPCWYPII